MVKVSLFDLLKSSWKSFLNDIWYWVAAALLHFLGFSVSLFLIFPFLRVHIISTFFMWTPVVFCYFVFAKFSLTFVSQRKLVRKHFWQAISYAITDGFWKRLFYALYLSLLYQLFSYLFSL